ncbi:DUF1651 domain-containing protein [bacterium]|nr:DUF1651 domain-containing protein [bacterium]
MSAEQQLVCQLRAHPAKVHAQWVTERTYSWVLPLPPMPQTRRRMFRHNAIKARDKMLKTGWRRCRPPVQ